MTAEELAQWLAKEYNDANRTFWELDWKDERKRKAWLLTARELLKLFGIKNPVRTGDHWNCGYCNCSHHTYDEAEQCCKLKSHFFGKDSLSCPEASGTEDESKKSSLSHKSDSASVQSILSEVNACHTSLRNEFTEGVERKKIDNAFERLKDLIERVSVSPKGVKCECSKDRTCDYCKDLVRKEYTKR